MIKRGERLTSIRQIAEWVAWYERGLLKAPNPKTISEILDWLCEKEMIEIYNKGNSQETHYNVVNYCIYQSKDDIESNAKVTVTGEVSKQLLDTNKNGKNGKNYIEVLHTSMSTEVDSVDKIPYQEIVNLYHSICVSYPKLKTISSNRQKAISARWKQYKKDISAFKTLFQKAEQSEFLKGANNRNWQADFNWLMNDANMAKVLEGKYDKKLNGPQPPTERKETAYERAKREAFEALKKEGVLDE